MRRRNALAIVTIVRGKEDISRAELAREANLSPATVSSIVDELLASGILNETGSKSTATQRGRRPIGLVFNPKSRFAAGASLEASLLRIVLCDLDGHPMAESTTPCDQSKNPDDLASIVMDSMKDLAKKSGIPIKKICALGISLPSQTDQVGWDKIMPANQLGAIFPQRELWVRLQKKLKRSVVLDSHVNMAAIAESLCNVAERTDSVMVVRLGNVVRSALVVQGQLVAGSSKLAGEIGHIQTPGNNRPCECGNVGCVNTVASPVGMLKTCRERGCVVESMEDLIAQAQSGNRACSDVLAEAARAVGFAIALCVNILAPNQIIVSGAATEANELFLVPLFATIRKHSLKANFHSCTIMASELKQMAESLGAALKALATEPRLLLFGTPSEISTDEELFAPRS